jgi:hypothetical protein
MAPHRRIFSLAFIAICLIPSLAVVAEEDKTSDQCAVCHEQETKDWEASKHARAINPNFLGVWEREGKKWECLVCHASQFDRKNSTFSHAGVSCESCHGAPKDNHPDDKVKGKMTLPVTSEVCQSCHSITYGEWRISAHGQKGIRCFDCHKMHSMRLRKDDPDQMCGSCHTSRLQDFSHATHHLKGVQCISCHMPEIMSGTMKIKGAGLRGHTFGVGAETCTHCHREMVHQSHETATLEQEVTRLKSISPEALEQKVSSLQNLADKLKTDLQANQRVFVPLIGLAFLLGAFFGYAVPHYRGKKNPPPPENKKP